MDPTACLLDALSFIECGEFDEAAYRLKDYFDWRVKGGFEPTIEHVSGDSFYGDLLQSLATQCQEPATDDDRSNGPRR